MKTLHLISLLFLIPFSLLAQNVPPLVNYQGRLSNPDGSPLATGNYQISFSVFDAATNGDRIWGPQIFDGAAGLGQGALIPVVQGYFNVLLGPSDANGLSLAGAFNGTNRFVEVTVSNHPPIAPRQQILATPFAFQAANAGTAALASNVASGINITNAVISSSVFAGNGAGLTNLTVTQLPATVLTNNQSGVTLSGSFSGDGGGLTDLNVSASQLAANVNNNLFVGPSGNATTSGSFDTAVGVEALAANTSGFRNTAHGYNALHFNTTGTYNTAVGAFALFNTTNGFFNTADGAGALYANTTGYCNTAGGASTLYESTTGYYNTAHGFCALNDNTTGSENTAAGAFALYNNTTGSYNIALGYQAGMSNLDLSSSNIDIGNQGGPGDNNIIRIGSNQVQTYLAGISGITVTGGSPVYVNDNGQLGTLTSSARFKHNIQSMNDASDALLSLHPVTFQYKPEIDPAAIPQFGLVAEEVEKVNPALVLRDKQGKISSVRYEAVNAMLLNEFLKEHRTVQEQKSEIHDLQERLGALEKIVLGQKSH